MQSGCFIIAEAGVNHNGSLEKAMQLVDAAVDAGANAVKFQTFRAKNLVTRHATKAHYQQQTTGNQQSQYEMLKHLELKPADYRQLQQYSHQQGIQFFSSAFDNESLDFLVNELQLPVLKIASGEITNGPFLLAHARTGKSVILSTGMATLAEIEQALAVLAFGYIEPQKTPSEDDLIAAYVSSDAQALLRENVTLLHCTTEYPAPFETINLRAMETLHAAFSLPVGYSDHSQGISIPIAAAARGAVMLEKHFTLDRQLPGPDHRASLEPEAFKQMVQGIRQVEQALGMGLKLPYPCELENQRVARKSLVAARVIRQGECFSEDNLAIKRPGTGFSPMHYWALLGRSSDRDYAADELIRSL